MTSMTSAQEPFVSSGGVFHENRDQVAKFRAFLPLIVVIGDAAYRGNSFTMSGFDIAGPDPDNIADFPDPRSSTDQKEILRISLYGFVCEIVATARFKGASITEDGEVLHFVFTQLDVPNRTALQRVIRSYMSGYVATPGDLTEANDPPTAMHADHRTGVPARSAWRPSNIAGMLVSVAVLAGAGTLLSRTAYDRFFIIQPDIATVSAPEVILASPVLGQVMTRPELAGTMVGRDQALFSIAGDDLDAEITDAQALVDYLKARGASAEGAAAPGAAGQAAQGAIDRLSQPAAGAARDPAGLAALGAEAGQKSDRGTGALPNELETGLAEGRLKALQMRKSALTGFSPCDCRVAWMAENGSWLAQGDRAATLVRTGPEDLKIEALLPLETARGLSPGQTATIRIGDAPDRINATVTRVLLDPDSEPRFGLPENQLKLAGRAAVMLRTDAPLPPEAIGAPVEVRIDRPFRLFGFGAPEDPAP